MRARPLQIWRSPPPPPPLKRAAYSDRSVPLLLPPHTRTHKQHLCSLISSVACIFATRPRESCFVAARGYFRETALPFLGFASFFSSSRTERSTANDRYVVCCKRRESSFDDYPDIEDSSSLLRENEVVNLGLATAGINFGTTRRRDTSCSSSSSSNSNSSSSPVCNAFNDATLASQRRTFSPAADLFSGIDANLSFPFD